MAEKSPQLLQTVMSTPCRLRFWSSALLTNLTDASSIIRPIPTPDISVLKEYYTRAVTHPIQMQLHKYIWHIPPLASYTTSNSSYNISLNWWRPSYYDQNVVIEGVWMRGLAPTLWSKQCWFKKSWEEKPRQNVRTFWFVSVIGVLVIGCRC